MVREAFGTSGRCIQTAFLAAFARNLVCLFADEGRDVGVRWSITHSNAAGTNSASFAPLQERGEREREREREIDPILKAKKPSIANGRSFSMYLRSRKRDKRRKAN
jgi:hypothetical protein